jgi:hypothetical protein
LKNAVFWDVTPYGFCEEEHFASIIRVKRISELGTTVAGISNCTRWEGLLTHIVPPKPRFSQEPHGVTSQKTAFFMVTAVKT